MLIFVNFKHIKIMIKIQLLVKNRKIKIINEKSIQFQNMDIKSLKLIKMEIENNIFEYV